MNRYPLNSRTLGSGVSVPEKYWEAAINVVVSTAVASVQILRGVFIESSTVVAANSTNAFKRFAALAATLTIRISETFTATRVQKMLAAIQFNVTSAFAASVGVLRLMASAVATGVETEINTKVTQFLIISQNITDTITAVFGTILTWGAAQNVQVQNTLANFTAFGEYAPAERYIIVNDEDRDIEVN